MLQLKSITKSYTTGDFTQKALKEVNLNFRKNEFVAILGQSGSGKTTMLNIIGGLDRYDSGDLIINGKSTKNFKNKDWDAYRNNSVGFIFQSYNLINHISVLQNVEMGMTLSGVNASERKQKALEVLERVGLKEHAKKKPNQLSGGQMQRVAIARALANNPDIILADEPTGALDSTTSLQIIDLIHEIAEDKLVIMVTHNSELAKHYANRIIELKDGEVLSDSNPIKEDEYIHNDYNLKKTAMSFLTALKLSFNNIMTKKGRTIMTAFASSIGIIGIALIMSLSNGFDKKITNFEADTMSKFPIIISQQTMNVSAENLKNIRTKMKGNMGVGKNENKDFTDAKEVYPYNKEEETIIHENKLTDEYVKYIEKLDSSLISGISYTRIVGLNLMTRINGNIKILKSSDINFSIIPKNYQPDTKGILENNYDILTGKYPSSKNEVVLVVDKSNRIDEAILEAMGITAENIDSISFDNIIGTEFKLILNNDFYKEANGYFRINNDLEAAFNSKDSQTLKVSGIVRINKDSQLNILDEGIAYSSDLVDFVLDNSVASDIVLKQQNAEYNVLSGEIFDSSTKEGLQTKTQLLSYLGANGIPYSIMIFPKDFNTKDNILEYLDNYNIEKEDSNMILYTDMAEIFTTLSGGIMDAITIVLIAFSSISLIVSMIMIGIITYISVLERTKEIGVLRALGARKKDITRVFNAETFIIGLFSGGLGILIAWLLLFPANIIIEKLSDLPNVGQMNPVHAFILIIISLILTMLGGFIPAKLAAKKDPVAALRTE